MNKRYIYANVRLPIEITEDGSFQEIYSDRMTIDFETCEQLPEAQDIKHEDALSKVLSLCHTNTEIIEEDEKEVTKEEEEKEVTEANEVNKEDVITTNPLENLGLEIANILRSDMQYKTPRKRQNISFKKKKPKRESYTRKILA